MLCVPRSSSPVNHRSNAAKSSPSPSRSKFFARRDAGSLSKTARTPSDCSTPSASTSDASGSSSSTTEGSAEDGAAIARTPSITKRTGSKWLDFMRPGSSKGKVKNSSDAETSNELASTMDPGCPGTTGPMRSGSKPHNSEPTVIENNEPATTTKGFSSLLGINWRPKEVDDATKIASRPTPSPLPITAVHDLNSDSEDETTETEDSDDGSSVDLHPSSMQPPVPPPAAFYPSNRNSVIDPRRPAQPLRSHTNLIQLTTASLQASPSPHPLITPRSNGAVQLFPRSSNLSRTLPRPRSLVVTLHKTRIIQRLEFPGSLTAAEELSIMPFATRSPGLRSVDRSERVTALNNSIYPSTSYRQARSALARNLIVEDGDLMREVDQNAHAQGQGCPTYSKGLKRWLQRPSFEQRTVMWTPASHDPRPGMDIYVVRTAVYRPALKGPAPLVFSVGLEALAGVVRQRSRASTWKGILSSVNQVVAHLHHPKPVTIPGVTQRARSGSDGLPSLHIPSPPQLSSSPSSSTSTDTSPNTPGSNNSSSQNLPSFSTPAFMKRLQSNTVYVDPNVSDEDDVPLGVVVISKRSGDALPEAVTTGNSGQDDEEERLRRKYEKEKEKERRRAKEAEKKKMYMEQILASRRRREQNRFGGRTATISDEWIEVDSPSDGGKTIVPKREMSPQRPKPRLTPRDATTAPLKSSSQSIRSQGSVRSRARPPSMSISDVTRNSLHQLQMQQLQAGMAPGMMAQAQLPYVMAPAMAPYPYGQTPAMNPYLPIPNAFFNPPTPTLPSRPSNTTRTAGVSRRDSVGSAAEFGSMDGQRQYWSLPNRSTSPTNSSRRGSQHFPSTAYGSRGLEPPSPRRYTSSNSSDHSSGSSTASPRSAARPRRTSSMLANAPMTMPVS